MVTRQLAADSGYVAVPRIPGIEPVLAAMFFAEMGDVLRFADPVRLTNWAGLTSRHRCSQTGAPPVASGNRPPRW
ncbi:transposase [Nocardia terpenica]|uniref:transposase n=1 Tax=Nocardia terpenica TaxID=455432 RepID=UPI00397EE156